MVKGRLFIFFAVMTVATEWDSASLYPKKPYGVKMCYELCRSLTACGVSYIEKSLACDLGIQKPPTRDLHQTKDDVTAEGDDIRRLIVSRGGQRVFVYIGVKTQETHIATVPNSVLASTTSPESRHANIHYKRFSSKLHAVISMTPSVTHHNIMYLLTRPHRQYYIQAVNITTSHLLASRFKLHDNRHRTPVQLYSGTCVRHTSGTCVRVLYVDRHIYTAALEEDPLHIQLQEDTNMRVASLHDAPTFCFTFKSSDLYCLNTRSIYKLECTVSVCSVKKVSQILRLPFSATDVKIDPYTWGRVVTVTKYAVNVGIFDHDKGTLKNDKRLRIKCKTVAWLNDLMYYLD